MRLVALLFTLGLCACAETVTSDQVTSSATLQRDYDKTLTKAEKDAAISELQGAKAKQQGGAAQNGGSEGDTAKAAN